MFNDGFEVNQYEDVESYKDGAASDFVFFWSVGESDDECSHYDIDGIV